MRSRSYVIVSWPGPGGRVQVPHRRGGRHRLGTPGRVPRWAHRTDQSRCAGDPGRQRSLRPRRGRHRRTAKPSTLAARYGSFVVLIGTLTVSGWFAAGGAAAFAQMVQP